MCVSNEQCQSRIYRPDMLAWWGLYISRVIGRMPDSQENLWFFWRALRTEVHILNQIKNKRTYTWEEDTMDTNILLESGTNELEVLEFTWGDNYYGINVAKIREILTYQQVTPFQMHILVWKEFLCRVIRWWRLLTWKSVWEWNHPRKRAYSLSQTLIN